MKVYKSAAATITLIELRDEISRLSVMRVKPEDSDIRFGKLSQTILFIIRNFIKFFSILGYRKEFLINE